MSEKAPSPFKQSLDDFEQNKAEHDAQRWTEELQGDAGKTDFSDKARQRLDDLDAYYKHLEDMAGKEGRTADDVFNEGQDRLDAEDAVKIPEMYAAAEEEDHKWEEDKKAKFLEKINSDARLRRIDAISQEVENLHNKKIDGMSEEEIAQTEKLIQRREGALEALLSMYEESDDFDPLVADFMMDRSTNVAIPEKKTETEREHFEGTLPIDEDDTERVDWPEEEPREDDEREPIEDDLEGDEEREPLEDDLEDDEHTDEREPIEDDLESDDEREPIEDDDLEDDSDIETGADRRNGSWLRAPIWRATLALKSLKDSLLAAKDSLVDRFSGPENRGNRRVAYVVVGAVAVAAAIITYRLTSGASGSGGGGTPNAFGQAADQAGGGSGSQIPPFHDHDTYLPNGGGTASQEMLPDASNTVHPNEGLYEVMQNNNVDPSDWHDRLSKIGPDLAKKGWAYFDNNNNEWRISHTGQLPQDVLDLIKNGK